MSTTYNRGFSFKLLVSGATSDISSAVATGTLDNITGNPTVAVLGGTTPVLGDNRWRKTDRMRYLGVFYPVILKKYKEMDIVRKL